MTSPARVVVGAAIVRDGRLLACRRTAPTAAVGRWELPGGKVEPGESHAAALVREVREELAVDIEVSRWLAGETPIGDRLFLRVAFATIAVGEPVPVEHDAVVWLGADELDTVDWLDADLPFLAEIGAFLTAG
jgi:8-oxo-dGTP diphosphatase